LDDDKPKKRKASFSVPMVNVTELEILLNEKRGGEALKETLGI